MPSMNFNFPHAPKVVTSPVSEITSTTAISGGFVMSDNGNPVTARGVCWKLDNGSSTETDYEPTINNSRTEDGIGIDGFVSKMTGLIPDTPYVLRAYATNKNGIGYGSTIRFGTAR
jgi:hypothetical protein